MVATSADALTPIAGPVLSLSLNPTRATPRGHMVPGWVQDANRPSAEAPRPAHDRIDGRSPGSRVTARHPLPGNVPVAFVVRARRLQLRGQLRNRNVGNQVPRPTPHSLFALT